MSIIGISHENGSELHGIQAQIDSQVLAVVERLNVRVRVKNLIRQAFESMHDGYSADRVIADPDLNAKFLFACQSFGWLRRDELNAALL